MQTVQDLTTREQEIEQELKTIADQKKQAVIAEKEAKLDLIESLETQAKNFRLEALEAKTEDAKKELYNFAAENQNAANALREELGLAVEVEVQDESEVLKEEKQKTERKINSLLWKALFSLGGFFIADFAGGKLEGGFFPYVLKYFASISYFIATAFGGSWLVCTILFYFISDYISKDFAREFSELKPVYRIALIATMILALLLFLNSVIPHAI